MPNIVVKFISGFILATAIAIGSVAKYKPELFFKLPNGFILWAMTGGPIPPYIIEGPFQEGNQDWLKDGDVVVSTAAKSGTTWMLFCSHQIRVKGDDEKYPYGDVSLSTPWPELIQTPGENWEIQREKFNTTVLPDGKLLKDYWDHPDYPFRVFKSHDHPASFGSLIGGSVKDKKKKVKFLAMARNGLDQIASMVPFFDGHDDAFRNLWGGFPPVSRGTLRDDAKERLGQFNPGGAFYDSGLPYVNGWWKVKDEENVLLLHYSDAKKDLPGTVAKMAEFYGVEMTDEERAKVVEKCGFNYMKKHEDMFGYRLPLNPNFDGTVMKIGRMIRKGQDGDGKVFFTEEEKEEWRKLEEEHFGDDPAKLQWARHGSLA
mmetsp:Transcript_9740/g.18297  ORF Transcript_9740/g.18297 Transcript_9740/m.18297 type:complete len:373 (-) Transcript_9740:3319-4437(-)